MDDVVGVRGAQAVRDLRVKIESLPNSALYGAASEVFLCTGLLDL